jgi:hypothetical protein
MAIECKVDQRVHLPHQKNLRSATIFSLGSRGPGGVVFQELGPLGEQWLALLAVVPVLRLEVPSAAAAAASAAAAAAAAAAALG